MSFLLGYTESFISDRWNIRGHIIVFNALVMIIGIAVLGFAAQPYVRYFGAFLVVAGEVLERRNKCFIPLIIYSGSNSNVCASMTYQANNVVGQWKRAFTSANMVAMGGVGGIIGGTVFRTQDSPNYYPGLATCFTAAVVTILSVTATTIYMLNQNRKQAKGLIVIEGVPGFRYTL